MDEFGPFVTLLSPLMGFGVSLWPPKQDGDMFELRIQGEVVEVADGTERDSIPTTEELVQLFDEIPDLDYIATRKSLDFSWFIARHLIQLEDIYDVQLFE